MADVHTIFLLDPVAMCDISDYWLLTRSVKSWFSWVNGSDTPIQSQLVDDIQVGFTLICWHVLRSWNEILCWNEICHQYKITCLFWHFFWGLFLDCCMLKFHLSDVNMKNWFPVLVMLSRYQIGLRYTGGARMLLMLSLKFGIIPIAVPVGVRDFDIDGELWVKLRLIPTEPWVGAVSWAFVSLPKIKFELSPFRLFNLMGMTYLLPINMLLITFYASCNKFACLRWAIETNLLVKIISQNNEGITRLARVATPLQENWMLSLNVVFMLLGQLEYDNSRYIYTGKR